MSDDGKILMIGSQAILAAYSETELPPEATVSIEADMTFLDDSREEKADRVDGAIGEASMFHLARVPGQDDGQGQEALASMTRELQNLKARQERLSPLRTW